MNKLSPALLETLQEINRLRERMGAEKISWVPFKKKLKGGISVGLHELKNAGEGLIALEKPDGRLAQVIVYIPYGEDFKFHIAWCVTLEKKRRHGDFKTRYVATNDTSGLFDVWRSEKRKEKIKLYVCRNCLTKLNWKGYAYEI